MKNFTYVAALHLVSIDSLHSVRRSDPEANKIADNPDTTKCNRI